jgi:mono/diheme cytochrome c family protein
VTPILSALWENDLRHYFFVLNMVVLAGLVIYLIAAVLSPKKAAEEDRSAANLTKFFDDEDLEGRRLERVQGWALLFAAIVAVTLPLYWLREPTRQEKSVNYFDENAVDRGAVLFANSTSEAFNSAVSLQCANCHGSNGEGGVAPTVVDGKAVAWKAPALNTELLRFSEEEVNHIITYGRPGTPMQPWGLAGGGPKNEQSIDDLVAFIRSIQLTPEESQDNAQKDLEAAQVQASEQVKGAQEEVAGAQEKLAAERTAAQEALGLPGATDAEIDAACDELERQVDTDPDNVDRDQAAACRQFVAAQNDLDDAEAGLAWARDWEARRVNVSDGQYLFELFCARCHTEGWSIFDPSEPDGTDVLGLSGGGGGQGGGIGFNLRDGATERRFGSDEQGGFEAQVEFVTQGSEENMPYGRGGIGTGRMPGFGEMLTDDMIKQIVAYERYCLGVTTYTGVTPACDASGKPRVPATTTTLATSGG